jgi:hypothetical protein
MTTTDTESCSTSSSNKLTTVKTIYARAAVVLLALNFCLTGYVVLNMSKTTQTQIDAITGATSPATSTLSQEVTTPQTPATTESQGGQPTLPTRNNE